MAKMNVEKRVGYLTGLIDMLAYQAAATGNNKKAICITDSFYREQKEQSWKRLLTVLEEYSDKRPEILVTALAKQLCKD